MKRIHAFVIAAILAAAAVAGLVAVLRTTQLSAAAGAQAPTAQIAQRNRQLAGIERRLLAEAQRTQGPSPERRAAGVVYVRPNPIVHVVHRNGGEHEDGERESENDD